MHMRVGLSTHTFRNPAAKGAAKYRPTRFSPVPIRWHSVYPRL